MFEIDKKPSLVLHAWCHKDFDENKNCLKKMIK